MDGPVGDPTAVRHVAHDLGVSRLPDRIRDAVEAKFRNILDSAPDAIVLLDSSGRIALVNAETERLFGYRREELLGQPVEMLVPERFRSAHVDHREAYLAEPRTRAMGAGLDLYGRRNDGTEFPVEISLSPLDVEDGTLIMSAIRDVSEHRRADEARAQLAAIVESSSDAIIGQALPGTITSWNRGAEHLYGYAAAEIIGRPISTLVPPERADELTAILRRVRRGEHIEHHETVRARRDGSLVDVSLSIFPVRDGAGRISGMATIARDVTQRKKAEEERLRLLLSEQEARAEARAAERARAEAEAALRERADLVGRLLTAQEEERRRVAFAVHDEVTQVAISVHQHLQAFARHHPPRRPETRRELERILDLAQANVRAARRVFVNLRPSALDDLGLAAAMQLEVAALRADGWQVVYEEGLGTQRLPATVETALFRIAQEAFTNIRKHAGPTAVLVELRRSGRGIRLQVADRGRGFDPSAAAGAGPGERVGLGGIRERVTLLGGRCDISSRPGKGTRVRIAVPLPPVPTGQRGGPA